MTVADIRVGMPLDEFLELGNAEKFELIEGERRVILPNVYGHTYTLTLLYNALVSHILAYALGEVSPETTYILPDTYDSNWVKGSRIPDILFVQAERMVAYKESTSDWRTRPLSLVPDLVVEVVSPNDLHSELDEKVDAYLADGVRLIWLVDPQRQKVTIYAPDQENPIVLKGDAVLDGGDVIPGFQIELSKLFA